MKQQPHTITITTTQSSVRKWSFTFNTLFASLYGKFHKRENFYYILMIFFFGFSSRNFEFITIFFFSFRLFFLFLLSRFVCFLFFFLWLRLLFLSLFEFVELTRYAGQNIVWGEEKNIICRTIWTFVDDFICYCSRIFFCFFVNCFICYLCMRICRDARW